jgi:hypothetical protein
MKKEGRPHGETAFLQIGACGACEPRVEPRHGESPGNVPESLSPRRESDEQSALFGRGVTSFVSCKESPALSEVGRARRRVAAGGETVRVHHGISLARKCERRWRGLRFHQERSERSAYSNESAQVCEIRA